MFARTKRLMLRPAWPEDAAALAAAIGDLAVARMLTRVPHPYTLADAQAFVAVPRAPAEPRFVITAHDGATPVLVGGIAIVDGDDGAEIGYWITPSAWGRGYATEAARAVVDMARHALPIDRLAAWPFVDNIASQRVLAKLGFRDTGRRELRTSAARREPAPAAALELPLSLAAGGPAALPLAA